MENQSSSSSSEQTQENETEITTSTAVQTIDTQLIVDKIEYMGFFIAGVILACFTVLILSQYARRWKG